jgi:hypothetical protein
MTATTDFLGFDPSSTPEVESFESRKDPIPNGVYRAEVISAERKPTKQCPNSWFWELQFTIAAGEFAGRCIPFRFNVVHASEQAIKIGRGQLVHYLRCIGKHSPKSAADLCGVPIKITVATRKNTFTSSNGESVEGVVNEIVHIDSCWEEDGLIPW